jgi:hypothetical protein
MQRSSTWTLSLTRPRAQSLAVQLERAQRRGAPLAAALGLERSAGFTTDPTKRVERLLAAAEIAFELGSKELVQRLLEKVQARELSSPQRGRVEYLAEIFDAGRSGDPVRVLALVSHAEDAARSGDSSLALRASVGRLAAVVAGRSGRSRADGGCYRSRAALGGPVRPNAPVRPLDRRSDWTGIGWHRPSQPPHTRTDRGVSHRALLCDVGPGRGRSACCDSPDRGCGGVAAARGSAWAVGAVARCPGFGDRDVRRVPHRTPRARGGDAPGTRDGSTGVDGGTAREPRDRPGSLWRALGRCGARGRVRGDHAPARPPRARRRRRRQAARASSRAGTRGRGRRAAGRTRTTRRRAAAPPAAARAIPCEPSPQPQSAVAVAYCGRPAGR